MENNKILINDKYYDKDEILKDVNLKNELEQQLKKIHHRNYCKLKRREYIKTHQEQIKQYNKTEKTKDYQKEYQKKYRELKKCDKKIIIEEDNINNKRKGRPKKYILDDSLNLVLQL